MMFEAFLVIASAITVGLVASEAILIGVILNRRFLKRYIKTAMEVASEVVRTEVAEKAEENIESFRWTENF